MEVNENECRTNGYFTMPKVKRNELIEPLVKIYTQNPMYIASLVLYGEIGIGKQQLIQEVVDKLQTSTIKEIIHTDVNFNLLSKSNIYHPNKEIFKINSSPLVINILTFSGLNEIPLITNIEIGKALLDREIYGQKIPDNTFITLIVDMPTDFSFPRALSNKLSHIEIED